MIWFHRESARGLTATLQLRVRVLPRRRGMPFALQIDDGRLRIRPGAAAAPDASAAIHVADLLRLGVGAAAWPQLMSTGRLELTGDPFLAMRFPTLFRLPARARGSRPRPGCPPRARRRGSPRTAPPASG